MGKVHNQYVFFIDNSAGMPKGMMVPMMMNGMNSPQMMTFPGGPLPAMIPMGNGMQAFMMPIQMDKNQQGGQLPGIPTLGGMVGMGGMGGLGGMIPMMMMGPGGMPPGFMIPSPMVNQQNQNVGDKSKGNENDKQKGN
jgi:hypothetical protein